MLGFCVFVTGAAISTAISFAGRSISDTYHFGFLVGAVAAVASLYVFSHADGGRS